MKTNMMMIFRILSYTNFQLLSNKTLFYLEAKNKNLLAFFTEYNSGKRDKGIRTPYTPAIRSVALTSRPLGLHRQKI